MYMTACIVGLLKHRCAKSLVIDQKSQGSSDTLNCDKKTIEMGTAVQIQYIVSPAPPVTRHSCGLPD